jgi:hypothetical protein
MPYNEAKLKARVERARSAVGNGIKYKLGKGGFLVNCLRPDGYLAPSIITPTVRYSDECDCSGLIAWVLGMRRDQVNAKKWWSKVLPWIETTAVWKDATGPQRVFVKIPKPVPGCLVVYGDTGKSQGHIGVVSAVHSPGTKSDIDVIDCSSGMSKRTGDSIHERDGAFFLSNPKTIFCVLKEDLL